MVDHSSSTGGGRVLPVMTVRPTSAGDPRSADLSCDSSPRQDGQQSILDRPSGRDRGGAYLIDERTRRESSLQPGGGCRPPLSLYYWRRSAVGNALRGVPCRSGTPRRAFPQVIAIARRGNQGMHQTGGTGEWGGRLPAIAPEGLGQLLPPGWRPRWLGSEDGGEGYGWRAFARISWPA